MTNKLRFVSEGFKGFVRNGFRSAASVVTLASSLLLIGIFTTLMLVINRSVENINDFNEIVVYLKLDTPAETVAETEQLIAGIKNVTKVTYISKDEALEQQKETFSKEYGERFSYIIDSYDETTNPLPDTFKIEYDNVEDIDAIVYNIRQLECVDKIKNRYDIAKNIENFKNALKVGGGWLMVLLVAVSIFVISNTIRLTYHAREMEITVMRYIGATKRYIILPFLFEGLLVGLVSGLVGYLVQYYLNAVPLMSLSDRFSGYLVIPPFAELNHLYLLIYFAAGVFIGVFGSAMAIRRYMKA